MLGTFKRQNFLSFPTLTLANPFLNRPPNSPAALAGPESQPSLQGGCTMRTDFDFSPYYRATIGFDRVFDLLDSVASQPGTSAIRPTISRRQARMLIASSCRWRASPKPS